MSAYLRLQPDCTHVCPLCHTKPGTCPVLLRVDAPATSHTGATHETGLRVLDFQVDSASWGTPLPIPLSTLEGRAQPWVWRLATVPSDGGDTGSLHGGGGGPRAPRPPFPRSLAPQSLHRLCGNPRTSGRSGADHGRSPSSRVSVASPLSGTPHPTAMPRPTQTLRPRCHGDGDAPRLRPRCGRQRVSPPRRKEPTRAEASAALLPK